MLPGYFVVISVLIRLISGGRYAWGVTRGLAEPNPVTWLLWAVTPLIAFIAQLQHGLALQSIVLLALFLSPAVIAALAIARQGFWRYLTPFTSACAAIAVAGIVLWRITDQPAVAIAFAIAADIAATLPTLRKSYRDPASEYALPYLLSAGSMVVTLLTIRDWSYAVYAFPLYMLCVNLVLAAFAHFPLRVMLAAVGRRPVAAPALAPASDRVR